MIDSDTLLPLEKAAKIAFPRGEVDARVLRRMIIRGRLNAHSIESTLYVTLGDIEEWLARWQRFKVLTPAAEREWEKRREYAEA